MDSLGDRMKSNYEGRSQTHLIRRMPVIIRLDGRSFHTLTRGCDKPFDEKLSRCVSAVALYLCSEVQGVKCVYMQSDEISLLLTDFDTLTTMAWFDYNVQKVVSVSASMASVKFSELWGKAGVFDSRAFNVPKEEVANYFVWRQKDWIRNSVMMLAQAHFSHAQLHKQGQVDMHDMLHSKGINWNDLSDYLKRGTCIKKAKAYGFVFTKWVIDEYIPIFTKDREYIEQWLKIEEESTTPPKPNGYRWGLRDQANVDQSKS